MSDLERRSVSESRIEADQGRMRGYAIVFNALSLDLGGFREVIAPEAVDRALSEASDVRALVDHDTSKILGRTRSGTLSLRKDGRGLQTTIEPDLAISYAADLMRSIKRGDVSGMSFGFRVLVDDWDYDGDLPVRTVRDMRLSEVSVVTFPAYEQTDVQAAVRSLEASRRGTGSRLEWLKKWHKTRTV